MLKNFFLVGLGGAAGSMLRFLFSIWFKNNNFPLATFIVNILGCFVIRNPSFESNWKLFLATGICGGFTTFSAFSMESLQLLQQQKIGLFVGYILASICLGLLATWLGYSLLKS
jgi:CrcB protein